MITRPGLADEIDGFDLQIKALNDAKSAAYKAYREQLEDAGMEPRRASAEVAATKAAIVKRRKLRENPEAAREKDDMIDAILVEIMERPSRAREATQSYAEAKGREFPNPYPQLTEDEIEELRRLGPAELTDTQEQPDTATQSGVGPLPGETASEGTHVAVTAGETAPLSPSPETPQAIADDEAAPPAKSSAPISSSVTPPPPGGTDKAGDVPPPSSPAALSEAEIPAFIKSEQRKSIADYRPNCLHPDACGASGLDHCYACTKAMEAAEMEAA